MTFLIVSATAHTHAYMPVWHVVPVVNVLRWHNAMWASQHMAELRP